MAQKKKRTRQAPSSAARTRPGSPAKARSGNPAEVRKATARDWISGARIRTLPLAVAPVAIGAGAARALGPDEGVSLGLALLCLAVAVLLQIGVNYANDYSDGVRGTDDVRVGPARLTGSGAAKPRTVLTVALAFFGLAAVAGLAIVLITGHWWLLAVGAVAIVAAYFYTGGKRPYGYAGLGDVVVFVFFGLVATAGTQFILIGMITGEGWLGGVAAGGFACAVLMVNNIRDIEQDGKVGKRTLAVRLGPRGSRIVYCVEIAIAYGVVVFFFLFYPKALLVLFTLVLALPAAIIACRRRPRDVADRRSAAPRDPRACGRASTGGARGRRGARGVVGGAPGGGSRACGRRARCARLPGGGRGATGGAVPRARRRAPHAVDAHDPARGARDGSDDGRPVGRLRADRGRRIRGPGLTRAAQLRSASPSVRGVAAAVDADPAPGAVSPAIPGAPAARARRSAASTAASSESSSSTGALRPAAIAARSAAMASRCLRRKMYDPQNDTTAPMTAASGQKSGLTATTSPNGTANRRMRTTV